MVPPTATPLTVADGDIRVSALLETPPNARACYVLAHGAGAGMTHPFMAAVAAGLFARGIATLRYQFPYMEAGSKRPDPPHARRRRCAPPSPPPRASCRRCRWSPAANRSAGA